MDISEEYDAIIIGAGQAGGPLSTTLAKAGWRVALIEREHVGGTCVNEGCTPTKTMVASARVAHLARRADAYGVQVGPVSVDLAAVRERKREIVRQFREGSKGRIEQADGVDLIYGEARFTGSKEIDVRLDGGETQRTRADKIFIDVGTRPAVPEIPGLAEAPILNSTSIMELEEVPEHLLILGGGYVGLEFAQMFRRFGSRVTIIQKDAQLLTREDADIAEEIANILRDEGIDIFLDAKTSRVEKAASGEVRVMFDTPNGQETVQGSHLLVATGRTPNSDSLDLEAAGVHTDKRGYITVNERLETNVAGVYALGDINGGPQFTHISYDDFRIIRTNLLEGGSATTKDRPVPYVVFIDPQLGRVGLSEREAQKQGRNYLVAKLPMAHVARAIETGETRGLMKALVDADTGEILGCAVLGIDGGEVMALLQMAMMGKVPYTVLEDAIFAHPTLAESLNNLFLTLEERPECKTMTSV